ncbi:BnaA05g28170D [Brassica napus]|uniref:BnaA05g28170D protein n=1 Tax=Brassica napus TaxID=3708 RepID=A0A078F5E1_BRANA|nr:BnaA05g28170D [Brassica napus]
MVLSKRWRFVWTKVHKLEYKSTRKEGNSRVWWLIEKSLQLHKAHVLESLPIQVDYHPNDAILRNCVSYALDHSVRELALCLPLYRTQILYLPRNVYTSKTLVKLMKLTLSCRTLVVDVPSLPCLPSLLTLVLLNVVYKDQNSHVRLLSNCPALRHLEVQRNKSDNVTRFIVKVPSLKSFTYMQIDERAARSFVLDSPGLRLLTLGDPYGDLDSIQNMPHLEWATVCHFLPYPNDNNAIQFPQLMKFTLHLHCLDDLDCSLEPLLLFLHNSPVLKVLMINYDVALGCKDLPLSWNQQSSVPGYACCPVLRSLCGKVLEEEEDKRENVWQTQSVLKTARISPICYYNLEKKEKIVGGHKIYV